MDTPLTTTSTTHPRVAVAISLGARPWVPSNGGSARYYLNDWSALIGLDIDRYNTGNIMSASLKGQRISNTKANELLQRIDKIWLDESGVIHMKSFGEPRVMSRADILEMVGDALDERAETAGE